MVRAARCHLVAIMDSSSSVVMVVNATHAVCAGDDLRRVPTPPRRATPQTCTLTLVLSLDIKIPSALRYVCASQRNDRRELLLRPHRRWWA